MCASFLGSSFWGLRARDGRVRRQFSLRRIFRFAIAPLLGGVGRLVPGMGMGREGVRISLDELRILRGLMDTPGVLVVVSDSQGRIIRFNGEGEWASGYSQEEVLGRSLTQFLRFREGEHPGGAVFEGPEPGHFPHKLECRLVGRGGEGVWVAWSNWAELHSDGSVRWVISIGVDITERNQALRNLQLFRQGIERSGEVVFLTDLEGRIIYVNPAFEETYGIPGEEAIGGTPRVLKSGVQSPEVYEAFWRKITRGETFQGEFVNRARDGRIVHVEGSANPILDEDGRPVAFLAIQRDVTKRIETETALKQSEERFRTLMEKIPEGLAVVTGEGQVRYANPAFLRLLGKSPDEVQGRMVQEFMPREEGGAFGQEIRVTQGGKADLDGEFHLTRAGGESTPVSVSARSLELGGQSVVLLTDLIMSRMGGRRLYQAVKEEGNHTRFLFASGYDTETAVGEEELRRELPFLAKPSTIQELTQRVREVLDRGPSA